jgi:hypothetical protein
MRAIAGETTEEISLAAADVDKITGLASLLS